MAIRFQYLIGTVRNTSWLIVRIKSLSNGLLFQYLIGTVRNDGLKRKLLVVRLFISIPHRYGAEPCKGRKENVMTKKEYL
jgi:hypothetical protein